VDVKKDIIWIIYDRSIVMQVIMYCDAEAISYAYRKTIIVDNIKIIDDTWIDEEVVT